MSSVKCEIQSRQHITNNISREEDRERLVRNRTKMKAHEQIKETEANPAIASFRAIQAKRSSMERKMRSEMKTSFIHKILHTYTNTREKRIIS